MERASSNISGSPLVSIVVTTYQHQPFIAKCLDGILMQRICFPIEILVGEDESTDGTREICLHYAAEHPDRIRLFLRSRKDVMYIMGRPTGRANLLQLLSEAKGKYIALCEGDDYWIDPDKLQKQVDALENDSAAAACFTNAYNERSGLRTEYLDGTYTRKPGLRVEQSELVNSQGLPTCTVLFRSSALFPLPKTLSKAPTGDTLLYVHASNHGHFIYIPRITAVRSMHGGGIHSLTSIFHQYMVTLRLLPLLDEVSHYRHHPVVEKHLRWLASTSWSMTLNDRNEELAKVSWSIMAHRRKEVGWNATTTARNYLKAYWPRTERIIGRSWDRLRGRP